MLAVRSHSPRTWRVEQRSRAAVMAKCWAFYKWAGSVAKVQKRPVDPLLRAPPVYARLIGELGQYTADAMLDAAQNAWEDLSYTLNDIAVERVLAAYNASCLGWQEPVPGGTTSGKPVDTGALNHPAHFQEGLRKVKAAAYF